jgi:hypothetical protein
MYALPNWRIVNHRVPGLHGYFKGAPLRSPLDLAISFGAEQVIDELASSPTWIRTCSVGRT